MDRTTTLADVVHYVRRDEAVPLCEFLGVEHGNVSRLGSRDNKKVRTGKVESVGLVRMRLLGSGVVCSA
jgi:hypothetical protein